MEIISYHKNNAEIVQAEIASDVEGSWFHPRGTIKDNDSQGDFDYGRMRFLNKNLNYFYFENMLVHALKNDYIFNLKYKKTLEFLESLRTQLNEHGPFGRMCIWKLEPKFYLLPHRDSWKYHQHITRYIFCVSNHSGSDVTIKINGKQVEVEQGLLFKFFPAVELHEFINHSDENFYFLGFDYWRQNLLNLASQKTLLTKDSLIPYQEGYGGYSKKTMYMSKE